LKIGTNVEGSILGFLDRIPFISFYANTRGWKFVLSWSHRIAGLFLAIYLLLHIYTLSLLSDPKQFVAMMETYNSLFFKLLEWLLAVPLIFHTLNGARLILYESFGQRDNQRMIRWSFILGFVYIILLGFFIVNGSQHVPALFFWLNISIASLIVGYFVYRKIWNTLNSVLWKLQRITGAFLLVMLPAHMVFTHLNYAVGHQAATIIPRMQHYSYKMLDLVLIMTVLYHGAFGVYSIIEDYLENKILRRVLTILLLLGVAYFGYIGARLTLSL
jgi:succinate dehydrogenase cytochrome b556 subunit/succinate dehydrogenase hydrophobic membrane anchor protein